MKTVLEQKEQEKNLENGNKKTYPASKNQVQRSQKGQEEGLKKPLLNDSLKSSHFDFKAHRSKNQNPFFDNLITIRELSEFLGISQKTIQNWMALRKIPFVKIGQKTYFRTESLKMWIERKEFKLCL